MFNEENIQKNHAPFPSFGNGFCLFTKHDSFWRVKQPT